MTAGWLFIALGYVFNASRTKSFYNFDRSKDELSVNWVNKWVARDEALLYCSGVVMQGVREL